MNRDSLTILASLVISLISAIGASSLNNFRLKTLEEKVDNLTDVFIRLTKIETVLEIKK